MSTQTPTQPRERVITYVQAMILAILAERKSMTRRVMKPQPKLINGTTWVWPEDRVDNAASWANGIQTMRLTNTSGLCPYGGIGDHLIVKEASWIWCKKVPNGTTPTGRQKYLYVPVGQHVVYCADGTKPTERIDDNPDHLWRWKAGRFMPRWASRITLEITGIRIECLHCITEEDAMAEGVLDVSGSDSYLSHKKVFEQLWDSLNAGRGYGWIQNNWVFVIEFRRINQS